MEEKLKKSDGKTLNVNDKLTWEAPELYNLQIDKTLGGGPQSLTEDDSYSPGPAS